MLIAKSANGGEEKARNGDFQVTFLNGMSADIFESVRIRVSLFGE